MSEQINGWVSSILNSTSELDKGSNDRVEYDYGSRHLKLNSDATVQGEQVIVESKSVIQIIKIQ